MKLKTLITSLVLASSSVAAASPLSFTAKGSWSFDTAGSVRDHRGVANVTSRYRPAVPSVQPSYGQRANDRWYAPTVLLADSIGFTVGETRKFVELDANHSRYNELSIQASRGSLLLKQVRINFADGSYQLVRNIDTNLAAAGSFRIALDGAASRQVAGLVIYGENVGFRGVSEIDVLGR